MRKGIFFLILCLIGSPSVLAGAHNFGSIKFLRAFSFPQGVFRRYSTLSLAKLDVSHKAMLRMTFELLASGKSFTHIAQTFNKDYEVKITPEDLQRAYLLSHKNTLPLKLEEVERPEDKLLPTCPLARGFFEAEF